MRRDSLLEVLRALARPHAAPAGEALMGPPPGALEDHIRGVILEELRRLARRPSAHPVAPPPLGQGLGERRGGGNALS